MRIQNQLDAYKQLKQVKELFLREQRLKPLHKNNIKQYKAYLANKDNIKHYPKWEFEDTKLKYEK